MYEYDGLKLRNVETEDLERLRELRNDPSTWEMLTVPGFIDTKGQEQWFERMRTAGDRKYYVVCDGENDFIGIVRTDELDTHNRSIRVGADVVPELRGRGYGKKIYRVLKKLLFDEMNMHRVWLAVLDVNERAMKLYLDEGFKIEGRYREAVFRNGCYRDYVIMSILEQEYRLDKEA